MKILKFAYNERICYGVLKVDKVHFLNNGIFGKLQVSSKTVPLFAVTILAPADASKIILAGLNYREHAKELGMKIPSEPVIFMKPSTALLPHGGIILYPAGIKRLDYEAELALVIKKECRNITEKQAGKYILGYTCLNDITARDLQKKDGQWTRAKSFDTFCPVGPWIETEASPENLNIKCFVNGKLKQNSSTSDFIFPVEKLVAFISSVMTLYPGDIISTGTPPGIGRLKSGDTVEVDIEGIGCLSNKVIA